MVRCSGILAAGVDWSPEVHRARAVVQSSRSRVGGFVVGAYTGVRSSAFAGRSSETLWQLPNPTASERLRQGPERPLPRTRRAGLTPAQGHLSTRGEARAQVERESLCSSGRRGASGEAARADPPGRLEVQRGGERCLSPKPSPEFKRAVQWLGSGQRWVGVEQCCLSDLLCATQWQVTQDIFLKGWRVARRGGKRVLSRGRSLAGRR